MALRLMKGKIETRIQHENEPSPGLPAIFWHAKDVGSAHAVTAETEKLNRWSYDGIRWHIKMHSRLARSFCDQIGI